MASRRGISFESSSGVLQNFLSASPCVLHILSRLAFSSQCLRDFAKLGVFVAPEAAVYHVPWLGTVQLAADVQIADVRPLPGRQRWLPLYQGVSDFTENTKTRSYSPNNKSVFKLYLSIDLQVHGRVFSKYNFVAKHVYAEHHEHGNGPNVDGSKTVEIELLSRMKSGC